MTKLLIDQSGYFLTAAVVAADGVLLHAWFEKPGDAQARVGEVLCGRIRSVNKKIGAAFIDIGASRDGFLNLRRDENLTEGQLALVELQRPPVEDKGYQLRAVPRLRTLWVVWTPEIAGGVSEGASGRLRCHFEDNNCAQEGRDRLTHAAKLVGVTGELVFLPSATQVEAAAMRAHLKNLRKMRGQLVAQQAAGALRVGAGYKIPSLVSLFGRAASLGVEEVVFGQADLMAAAHKAAPVWGLLAEGRYRVWQEKTPLWEDRKQFDHISTQIEETLHPVVNLSGGGRVFIEETAALVAVDIDLGSGYGQSGFGTLRRVCEAAVTRLIREIALRELGGQIVIDFPAVMHRCARQFEEQLKTAYAGQAGVRIGRMTKGGLLDLTLPRRGKSLVQVLTQLIPHDPLGRRDYTPQFYADKALRALYSALKNTPQSRFRLTASQEIITLLSRAGVQARLGAQFAERSEMIIDPIVKNGEVDVTQIP